MVKLSDTITFDNIDLTSTIEKNLAYLKSMTKHANSYIVDLEDKCAGIIESYRNVGTDEKINSLEDDFNNGNENINSNIEDMKLKVLSSSSVVGASDTINTYYSNQLNSLRYLKNESDKTNTIDLLSLDNSTQNKASKFAMALNSYENDIINGLNISSSFKEVEKLIASQMNLNSLSMSSEMLDNIDMWNDELEHYKEFFMLTDNGSFDTKHVMDTLNNIKIEDYANGEMLNNIVPANYSSVMTDMLSSLENSLKNGATDISNSVTNILNQLPENFSEMNPLKLTTEYSAVVNDLMSELKSLESIGNLPTDIMNSLGELPNNITDMVDTIAGNLSLNVQDGLHSLVKELNVLDTNQLNSLVNMTNISDSLKALPSLDNLTSMIEMGDLSSLGNFSGELSNIANQLTNVANLPGNLGNVINSLPDNFSNILNGIGGVPGISTITDLTSNITGQISNIAGNVTGMVNNISSLASNALSSLGSLASLGSFGSLFGSGNTGSPGPVVPQLLY